MTTLPDRVEAAGGSDQAFEEWHSKMFFEHFAAQPLARRRFALEAFNAGFAAALRARKD